jgi:hypothetical protein
MARIRLAGIAAIAAGLAACGQANEAKAPADVKVESCVAEAQAQWAATSKTTVQIFAKSEGADCASAKATLTITGPNGKLLHTFEAPVEVMRNTIFTDANTPETMQAALGAWIDPKSASILGTTGGLPEWKAGAELPGDPEFPFMPAEGMARDGYAKMRAQKRPIYCYVQGGESENCVALDETVGILTSVGLQRFPG